MKIDIYLATDRNTSDVFNYNVIYATGDKGDNKRYS